MLVVDDGSFLIKLHLDNVVHEDEGADDNGLADFEAVQSCVNVDRVRAENSQHAHVDVIKEIEVDEVTTDETAKKLGHDDAGEALVSDKNRH